NDLHLAAGQNDVTAETAPHRIARHLAGVTVERYPGDLEIPAVEPVLAYLDSLADPPLSAPERIAACGVVQAEIDARGTFHIGKHTVLITARAR
ncbi:MAG TPA: hypothetical protein VHC49_06365, partial [Mycobacteriales bacterium]|nr:hypothetical protein [Mycobacteriales bacterium]